MSMLMLSTEAEERQQSTPAEAALSRPLSQRKREQGGRSPSQHQGARLRWP